MPLRAGEVNGEGKNEETLPDHDDEKQAKTALIELKRRIEDAIQGNCFLGKPDGSNVCQDETSKAIGKPKEIKLWGVPLMPNEPHAGTDTVLLKFLKSKNYNVHDAFENLKKTLIWRKEFKADEILEERLDPEFEKESYFNTIDKEGRPLFANVYGDLKSEQNKRLNPEEHYEKFLRWRVQYMEKCIKELNFELGGADSMTQVIDWEDFHGLHTREFRSVYRKWWTLLEEHYPEIIRRTIILNIPLWYHVSLSFSSRLITHKMNANTIFARPGKVTETLLKFVSPENLPVEYGGLKRVDDDEFSPEDKATEVNLKAHATEEIKIPAPKAGVKIAWDVTVVGWEVRYKEEFVPDDEGSYRVSLQEKEKKGEDKRSVRNVYYINEAGKIVISVHNYTNKCRKVFYRYKTKPTAPVYRSMSQK
ncbi:hypothetical protein like AT1G30690 [Hibiscus trionum]|uniref:CRAL-TRIO domain-containing protein n=1 Tax=Hibiscus trionum TaxID=183268 RepID=A0A9W7H1A9_HIBTR|nr:hypothetical protein like AT1G30690 [Hibiscus trionum]